MDALRALVVHNSYRSDSPSGEERVVDDDVRRLRAAGVEVDVYRRGSDEIAEMSFGRKVASVGDPIRSARSVREVRELIRRRRPDVVHLHNPFPLVSPWIVRTAAAEGVPVVQTVHNYRHSCVSGNYFRDGAVCTSCAQRTVPWPAVAHACYRGSRPQSAVMATSLAVHRSTWQQVTRFLAVTDFMAEHLATAGIARERIVVKPNCVPDPGSPAPVGRTLLYVGRLTHEKGLVPLIAAWAGGTHPAFDRLVFAGDGPARDVVQDAAARHPDIDFHGIVPPAVVHQLMIDAGAVVVPSLWFEGFPMAIVEAFAHGRSVIASEIGSLSAIVDDSVGWSFPLGDLARALAGIGTAQLAARGARARGRYLESFSPTVVTQATLRIYEQVRSGR